MAYRHIQIKSKVSYNTCVLGLGLPPHLNNPISYSLATCKSMAVSDEVAYEMDL